jgi:hypothetical protein
VIVIFGWQKQHKPLGAVGKLYCFECKRAIPWEAVADAEWVTLFLLRVLKFISRHHLCCTGCGAVLQLSATEFKQVDAVMRRRDSIAGSAIHAALGERIERMQLAGKTPTQVKFIRESLRRAEQDRQAAREASIERD